MNNRKEEERRAQQQQQEREREQVVSKKEQLTRANVRANAGLSPGGNDLYDPYDPVQVQHAMWFLEVSGLILKNRNPFPVIFYEDKRLMF